MYKAKYQLKVIDRETGKQVQLSDTHTWDELEALYNDYQRSYSGCEIKFLHVIDIV